MHEEGGDAGGERTRRDVLRGSAAAGLWGLFGGDGATPFTEDGGTAGAAGAANVLDYGAALDGESDDAEALRDAFAAAGPGGSVVVPAGGVLRLGSAVTFDLRATTGFQLRCHSPVAPDAGIGDAVTVTNGYPRVVDFWVAGGGSLADYRRTEPDGGERALVLTGVRGGEYRVLANGYRGRVLHVGRAGDGDIKTSKLRVPQLETRMYDRPCGQAFFVTGRSAAASFGSVWAFWDEYGPVVRDVYDVTIGHVESGWNANGGLWFDGASSVHVDTLALGDESRSVELLRIGGADGVQIGKLFTVGGDRGLVVSDSKNVAVGDFWGVENRTDVTIGSGVTHTSVNATMRDTHGTGVEYAGDGRNALRVVSRSVGGPVVEVGPAAFGDLALSGSVTGSAGDGIVVESPGAAVHVHGLSAHGNAGADLVVPEDNAVRVSDCALGSVEGAPRVRESVGVASADRERPYPSSWRVGDVVEFTDTGDGSGDGVYLRLRGERWARLGTGEKGHRDGETATTSSAEEATGFDVGAALLALVAAGLVRARGEE